MHKYQEKKQQQQQQEQEQEQDEALSEYLRPTKMPKTTSRKHMTAPAVPPPPPLPPTTLNNNNNNATSNGIYVIGNGNALHDASTLERGQRQRLSWMNMRRKGEPEDTMIATNSVTPSPQTTRSYVSGVSTTMVGGGSSNVTVAVGNGGTVSGRNTSASCRTITNSSSNNTLNDIISDYHSHEAGSSDYQYSSGITPSGTSSPIKHHISSTSSFTLANGSQIKLLSATDDEKNQQTKCSIFRGLVLCVCLNISYANVVRFPRELDRYGSVFLVPYMLLLFLVGLPVILLEVSVGQFLGQGAAHTWRASPIFKGACIISRFASWLSTIWISLQAVLALAYACMFLFSTFPFGECAGNVSMTVLQDGYTVTGNSGQECLQNTFLTPFWGNPLYFGLLSIGLICLWILIMLCTHSGKILRRSLFCIGLCGFMLLCTLSGWEIRNSVARAYFPSLWPFESDFLLDSGLWFDALMQVLFATNCGFGALPMITGKFLYKGDAVRTSIVYLCFNLFINALAVMLFVVQFERSANSASIIDELKPLTAIYDRILYDDTSPTMLIKLLPALTYILIVIATLVSLTVAIYTVTRLVPRHPNYVVGLVALVMSIISFSAPEFIIARLLDRRIVGTLSITVLIFELIAITWIYGAKNIYTDLEFSIGRPIFRGWMWLWCICPAILTAILVWWCSDDDQYDLLADYMPRWGPIIFALAIIFIIACVQIFRQVEYNFFGMICEASKSAKEWGPADPLARHAWKQWRSVCQDTGRRDFTLRRRGTRDYTHSIKKGQYSSTGGTKYANGGHNQHQHIHHNNHHLNNTQSNWKSSTPGNSSPNYSGSMFGDSAIEEDISVEKFPGITQQQQQQQQNQNPQQHQHFLQFHANNVEANKPLRNSNRAPRVQQRLAHAAAAAVQQKHQHHNYKRTSNVPVNGISPASEKHREVVYIRRLSDDGQQHATRIEITPSNESITYAGTTRNTLVHSSGSYGNENSYVKRSASTGHVEDNSKNLRHTSGSSSGNSSCTKLPLPTTTTTTTTVTGTGGNDDAHQNTNRDHICWRKFSVNVREYSTEL